MNGERNLKALILTLIVTMLATASTACHDAPPPEETKPTAPIVLEPEPTETNGPDTSRLDGQPSLAAVYRALENAGFDPEQARVLDVHLMGPEETEAYLGRMRIRELMDTPVIDHNEVNE